MHFSTRPYDAVTFDMGFTLVALNGGMDEHLLGVATGRGLPVTLDDVRAAVREVWREQVERDATHTWEPSPEADDAIGLDIDRRLCLRLGIDDPELHRQAHLHARQTFGDPDNYLVYPDVFPVLEALQGRGLTVGVISNWGWRLEELCQALGLAPYFDFIISSARIGAAKPHPAIFQAALARAGVEPGRLLHIGDSLAADVLGARQLGITGVLLDREGQAGGSHPPAPDPGYPVVQSLDQVPVLLEERSPER